MERPRPKELIVDVISSGVRLAKVTTSTGDARNWIEKEAPRLGALHPMATGETSEFYLYIAATYDFDEAVAYLRSYA